MDNNNERAFEWEDTIEKDGSDFVLLPEGDYNFTVTNFERGRHQGSEKLPPCYKAILTLEIDAPEGKASITHNLFLHTKTEGMLSAFFCAIGQKKHGERLKMDWTKVVGSTGRCKIYVDTYTKNDGSEGKSNKVKKFYDKEEPAKSSAGQGGAFVAGKF